jgi:hypothetical protein
MTVAEYLARCAIKHDYVLADADVGNILTHPWKRDDSTIVIDSMKLKSTVWASSDDLLEFILQGHDTQSPNSHFRETWEVRPSLTKGLKAECTEDSVAGNWIGENLLNTLRSNQ